MKLTDRSPVVEKTGQNTGLLLWQVSSLWQREIRKALEKHGLTHSQFVIMASIQWLSIHKKDVTQIRLSAYTKIDPMTTSTVLRTLQQKKLLLRQEHATDTRAKTVKLTERGKKIIKQAIATAELFDKQFFTALGAKAGDFNTRLQTLIKQAG